MLSASSMLAWPLLSTWQQRRSTGDATRVLIIQSIIGEQRYRLALCPQASLMSFNPHTIRADWQHGSDGDIQGALRATEGTMEAFSSLILPSFGSTSFIRAL